MRKVGMNQFKKWQKVRRCVAAIAVLGGYGLCGGDWPALAQTSAAAPEPWEQFQKADTRIQSCRVVWGYTLSLKPKRNVDVEKRVARARDQARQQGLSAEVIQRQAQIERKFALDDQKGQEIAAKFSIVRVGAVVRCDIANVKPTTERMIDFYDGKNALHLYDRAAEDKEDKRKWDGRLRRDAKEVLCYSMTGWLLPQFLTGFPLSQEFSPSQAFFAAKDTTVRVAPAGGLVLETKSDLDPDPEYGLLALHRLTLGAEHRRPVAYQVENLLCKETEPERVMGRVSLTDYRRYADGIWFPSKVTVSGQGFTTEYVLLQAKFNEAVDPMEVRLPPNARVADSRFGLGRNTVSYELKNGLIPTDDEVRTMLGREKEKTQERQNAESATPGQLGQTTPSIALPLAPVLGVFLMIFGCVLWGRSKSLEGDT